MRIAEITCVLIIIAVSYTFLTMRTDHACFPSGDEGSWMSVASQLARGEGFTTRWYEHPFLTHPMLPRPDDFRYPGLTLALAAAFTAAGTSYATALHTTTVIFILFLLTLYIIIRKRYGITTALTTVSATVFSLLQLHWNAAVYSEGLFGLGLCLLMSIIWFGNRTRLRTWILLGVSIAVLYYIRLNGILFLAGLPVHLFFNRKNARPALVHTGTALAVFLVVASPWMVRSYVLFGNPLHVAGGAGVLRLAAVDPRTWTVFEFIARYSPLVFPKATAVGFWRFFSALHFFEKNLFILPLAGLLFAKVRTRTAGDPLIAGGVFATLLACFYISHHESWAAVRYMSSLLPFLYASGIRELLRSISRATVNRHALLRATAPALPALLILSTVYYPHRFYLRHFYVPSPCTRSPERHAATLDSLIDTSAYYFADAYGQFAFMSTRRCVGIQAYVDSSLMNLYCKRYHPALLVLNENEYHDRRINGILHAMNRLGYHTEAPLRVDGGIYLRINHATGLPADQGTPSAKPVPEGSPQ